MTLRQSVRFAVLQRDRFTCGYCGRSAPNVILHVDHIVARANGGSDEMDNLVTACIDCNLGKAAGTIPEVPPTRIDSSEHIAEIQKRIAEARAYAAMVLEVKAARKALVDQYAADWREIGRDPFLGRQDQISWLDKAAEHLLPDEIALAMQIAANFAGGSRRTKTRQFERLLIEGLRNRGLL